MQNENYQKLYKWKYGFLYIKIVENSSIQELVEFKYLDSIIIQN